MTSAAFRLRNKEGGDAQDYRENESTSENLRRSSGSPLIEMRQDNTRDNTTQHNTTQHNTRLHNHNKTQRKRRQHNKTQHNARENNHDTSNTQHNNRKEKNNPTSEGEGLGDTYFSIASTS
jgi:hypothetical protein